MSVCTAARNNACAHYGHRAAVGAPFPVRRPCTRKKENVMVKFILKRIGTMIIAMFMIILITFTLMHSIPGGPFTNTKGVPEEVTQAMEAKYGLDQPMPVQFVKYLGSLLHGDFGPSYKYTGKTVNDFIATGAPVSAKLGLVTLVFVLLTSIPMGMNENVILEKNENYWDAENVSLQKVTFRYVLDQATALTAYESGEVDGVASIPSSDFARLKAENAGVQTSPSYGTVYYDFNCSAEPVNNVLVRKAICLAIDRQSIIDNVVQVDAQPAYSFLAPGYSVDGKDITEGRESFGLSATADVEGAQAALAEAGYPNGEGFPTLTLSYYDNDTVKKVVEAMAEMLKNNLNINVEVSSNEWSIFYDDVQKGNYQVAAMGWSADYVNPMSFLPLCKTGDSSNNLFYSNADYDALVEQVKAENDPAKAAELTLQADAIVSNDYAVLPLYYKSNNYLMHDNISGFYMTASGNLFFKDVKVG